MNSSVEASPIQDSRAGDAVSEPIRIPVRDLLVEVLMIHADPENPGYNECDVAPCAWCESARAHIADMDRAAAHECG